MPGLPTELLVLLAILALLIFGPRRHGGRPGPMAMAIGGALLAWLLVAYAFGWTWNAIVGPVAQP